MFLYYWLLSVVLASAPQPGASRIPEDGLTPSERAQLEKEEKIDNRIKIYEAASLRCLGAIKKAVTTDDFNGIREMLKAWTHLLSASLRDIDEHMQSKKKSRTLIHYEIHVRKAISDMQDFKLKVPVELHEDFDAWTAGAEGVHKKLVDILFMR